MAKGNDYLEALWTEVIDPQGKNPWVTKCLNGQPNANARRLKEAQPALQRLLKQQAAPADLEQLAAFVRYETCFTVLVALDDPGLGEGKLAGLHKDFLRSRPKAQRRNAREQFIQWLWETETFEDNGHWLKSVKAKDLRMKPFEQLFPAVRRLLKKARSVRDLGRFLAWNRHEACAETLRLLEEAGFKRGDEPVYLHEMLEEAYPAEEPAKTSAKAGAAPDVTQPLWRFKSVQALAFSPDSKTLAVAGSSSPIRLCELTSGQERLACEGLRVHIYRIVFSPDGKQVTAGQIHKELSVCNAKTGKLLHKLKRSEDEISGLAHAPSGELLCSAWCGDIAVFEAASGKTLPALTVTDAEGMVDAMVLFAKGTRLAALSDGTVTVWSWPHRKRLQRIKAGAWRCKDLAASPDGKMLAVAEQDTGIHLLDTVTGKRLGLLGFKDVYQGMAFTPDGNHLVLNSHKENLLSLWNIRDFKEVRKLPLKASACDIAVSPDGRFLAAATIREALVWQLPPLLQSR